MGRDGSRSHGFFFLIHTFFCFHGLFFFSSVRGTNKTYLLQTQSEIYGLTTKIKIFKYFNGRLSVNTDIHSIDLETRIIFNVYLKTDEVIRNKHYSSTRYNFKYNGKIIIWHFTCIINIYIYYYILTYILLHPSL